MKISNLRIERHEGLSYLTVDIQVSYNANKKLWFSVPTEFEDYLTDDVYDAFLVAALYPAMFYGEDIIIDGKVSHKLYFNCSRYMQHVIKAYRPDMNLVNIKIGGYANAHKEATLVGTGFSAGIDSFVTFYDHYETESDPDYKINTLFFFNVGSHGGGGEGARKTFLLRYNYLKAFADEKGLPYIPLDSNLFDFYQDHWEFDAGQFCRSCAILVLQRKISKYYLSSDYSYRESMFFDFNPETTSISEIVENFANPMLSTEGIEVITDGGQYTRIQKTQRIADYDGAKRYLNVCVHHWANHDSVENCGSCSKCVRTLVALDSIGKLENFTRVFNIEEYRKKAFEFKCGLRVNADTNAYIKENVEYADKIGKPFPSYWVAVLRFLPSTIYWKSRQLLHSIKCHFIHI